MLTSGAFKMTPLQCSLGLLVCTKYTTCPCVYVVTGILVVGCVLERPPSTVYANAVCMHGCINHFGTSERRSVDETYDQRYDIGYDIGCSFGVKIFLTDDAAAKGR